MEKIIIDIYNLSDFHGAILEEANKTGIVKIATYLKKIKEEKSNSYLFLSSGDMYSGTYFSELTNGKPLTQILNSLDLTCMGIGNHEIADPHLLKELINEASFPLLNTNVYLDNGSRLDIGKEYLVKTINGVKIGLISTLGVAQKNDIINTISKNLIVKNEIEIIKNLSFYLRKHLNCDIIILLSHSNTLHLEDEVAKLKNHEMVDVMINGHTHKKRCRLIDCGSKRKMAYLESGSSGDVLGNVRLILNNKHSIIEEIYVENIDTTNFREKDYFYQEIINYYIRDNVSIYSEVGVVLDFYNKEKFLKVFCEYLLEKYDCEVIVLNYGAIRATGFPLFKKQVINNSNIKEINPFNNYFMIGEIEKEVFDFFIEKYAYSLYFVSKNCEHKKNDIKVMMIDFVYYQNETLFKEVSITNESIPTIITKMIEEEKL